VFIAAVVLWTNATAVVLRCALCVCADYCSAHAGDEEEEEDGTSQKPLQNVNFYRRFALDITAAVRAHCLMLVNCKVCVLTTNSTAYHTAAVAR
jgi:hypothetical protein